MKLKNFLIYIFFAASLTFVSQVRAESGYCPGNITSGPNAFYVDCGDNCQFSCTPRPQGQTTCDGEETTSQWCWHCERGVCPAGWSDSCPSGNCDEDHPVCNTCDNGRICYKARPEPTAPPEPQRSVCINNACVSVPESQVPGGAQSCDRAHGDEDCRPAAPPPTSTPRPNPPTSTPRPNSPTSTPRPSATPRPNSPTATPMPTPTCAPGDSRPSCPGAPTCSPGDSRSGCPGVPTCSPGDNRPGCPGAPTPTRPAPTSTPRPTATPTITPTPQQRMRIVTPAPNNAIISNRASRAADTARTVCLNVQPCSRNQCTTGPNVIADHRVKLSAQPGKEVLAGINTYIIECLKVPTNVATICTSGNALLDNELFGTYNGSQSNYDYLSAAYGYTFNGPMLAVNAYNLGEPLSNPFIAPSTNQGALGSMGLIEWQSHTTNEIERTFYAINYPDDLYSSGRRGTQQQGTWVPAVENSNCIMISWDPYGTVFDSKTLEPIANAEVTLFKKRADGNFSRVEVAEVLGNFRNPYVTGADGKYNFNVMPGEYKLEVKAEGYTYPYKSSDLNPQASKKYENIYGGEVIVQGKTSELRNIPLDRVKDKTVFDFVFQTVKQVLKIY